ncbi:MAG: trigger factor [Verrucomicrobium sp.]|nr:trigger factor [Verrucomicrobium sp.]
MNITFESQPNCRAVYRIEIPAADVQREREEVTTNYARQARLPGFRPGKAPKAVVAKKYEGQIREELETALVRKGYGEATKRGDADILSILNVRDQALHGDDHYTFTIEVSTVPRFELPEYKGIPVKLPKVEVTDADVEHDLLHLRERYQSFTDVDREAALGDYVVLHVTGSVDGKSIEEAHPEAPAYLKKIDGNWFQLAEKENFLPGFYAALVGVKKDETRDVNVTLPEDFPFEPLKNQTVTLSAKCDQVKESVLPALDDEFAKKLNAEWDMERLRTEVRASIESRREQNRETEKTNQVIAHLADKLEFELPQDVVNREAQRRTNDIARNALNQGMDQDRIMEVQDQIVGAATQQAHQNVKVSFILGEVAKKEQLKVTEEQLRMALAQIAYRQKITPKKLLQDARKNNMIERLREDILLENAIKFLKDSAVIEEVEAEKEDCGHDHGHSH